MRLLTVYIVMTWLVCISAAAQVSFPATHLARLDILEPNPDAGTIGAVGIIGVDPTTGIAQIRVSAAPEGDAPDSLFLLYQFSAGTGVVIAGMPFPAGTTTFTAALPFFTPGVLASVDSGMIWLAVTRRSNHSLYATGPVQSIPSAVAPEPSGLEVVPPVTTTEGVGHCALTLDPATGNFRYTAWWLDLSGTATAARIRRASVGATGPVVFEMPLTSGSEQSIGIWENPGEELRNAAANGELYFEVVTSAYPGGELRGQIYRLEGFTAAIEPENEVPPVTGTAASGSAYLLITAHGTGEVFNKLQGVIGDLTGPITAAHIHRGAIGQSGDPVVTLERPTSRTIDLELASGSAGGALGDDIVAEIRAARTYVNVHTAANQSGEARGQLIPARTRLVTGSTGAVPATGDGIVSLSAQYDRSNRMITISAGAASKGRAVEIYAADGRLVRTASSEGSQCEISAAGLPVGPYFIVLRDGGRSTIGACPVMVTP